jgi:DNA-binding NarL/FixJ family response regulator
MLGAGACGYVLKQNAPRELIATIRAVAEGRQTVERTMLHTPEPVVQAAGESLAGNPIPSLTDTEQRVLVLVARACSNEQIAQSLCISVEQAGAVKNQAMRKAGLASRIQVKVYAQRRGWID